MRIGTRPSITLLFEELIPSDTLRSEEKRMRGGRREQHWTVITISRKFNHQTTTLKKASHDIDDAYIF